MRNAKPAAMLSIATLLLIALLPALVRAQDEEGGPKAKDAPYFSGMPAYKIIDGADKKFDDYRFWNGTDCATVEGRVFFRAYTLKEDAEAASELQISRNYANAVRNMGGTVVFEGVCEGSDCAENCGYRMMVGKASKGGNEVWIEVVPFNDGNDYYLTIVAVEAMKQEVTAGAMLEALNRDGRVALYINFDTGKATIRPDSEPVIAQITAMMKANPSLELSVEGHTDDVGDAKSNQTLSENRAKAVVAALVAKGVEAKRLGSAGFGQNKPVADNATEEGRAKNRRVELVKKGGSSSGAGSPASAPSSAAGAAKTEERFGVAVYPGARLDAEQTKYGKDAGFTMYCYRTDDGFQKVVSFYKSQKALALLISDETTALFGGSEEESSIKVTVSRPWTDPMTGKPRADTFIQIVNEAE